MNILASIWNWYKDQCIYKFKLQWMYFFFTIIALILIIPFILIAESLNLSLGESIIIFMFIMIIISLTKPFQGYEQLYGGTLIPTAMLLPFPIIFPLIFPHIPTYIITIFKPFFYFMAYLNVDPQIAAVMFILILGSIDFFILNFLFKTCQRFLAKTKIFGYIF